MHNYSVPSCPPVRPSARPFFRSLNSLVHRDRHGSLRRRVYSRHRGLSPSELDCLETVDYCSTVEVGLTAAAATAGTTPDNANTIGGDDGSSYYTEGGSVSGGGSGGSGIELLEQNRTVNICGAGAQVGGREKGGVEPGEGGHAETSRGTGDDNDKAGSSDCAICLSGFEDGDLLRKLPW